MQLELYPVDFHPLTFKDLSLGNGKKYAKFGVVFFYGDY